MKTIDIIEGLTILEKYRNKHGGHNVGVEHDQIFCYATDHIVRPEDLERLVSLGWIQEDYRDDKFTVNDYNPEEGWTCYV
jgi:hypothetical protein